MATSATSTTSLFGPTGSALPQTDDGGLSFGTKLGIGLGVSAGGLMLLISLALCVWRRRRWQRDFAIQASYDEEEPENVPEITEVPRLPELQGKELPRTHGRSELSASNALAELESSPPDKGKGKESVHDEASYFEGDDAAYFGIATRKNPTIPPPAHVT